jgi:hypothetical protein
MLLLALPLSPFAHTDAPQALALSPFAHTDATPTKSRTDVPAALAATPTPWTAWNGKYLRRESDGNLSCFSTDGTHCTGQSQITDPNAPGTPTPQPLVCGTQHLRSVWQVTGYNDANTPEHWCRNGFGALYADWNTKASGFGEFRVLAETPEGDLMCFTLDGKNCLSASEFSVSDRRLARPLVCGAHHRSVWGFDGYTRPGHWCQTPKILTRDYFGGLGITEESLTMSPWTADDEPGVIARVHLRKGESVSLGLRGTSHSIWGFDVTSEGTFGLEYGHRARVYAPGLQVPIPLSSQNGMRNLTAAVVVKRNGSMCFFALNSQSKYERLWTDGDLAKSWPAQGAPWSSAARVSPPSIAAPTFIVSSGNQSGGSIALIETLTVKARKVPIEGDVSGARRTVSYTDGCGA